jgi:hypothetical protein
MDKDHKSIIETELSGKDLMSNPVLNKGTAFDYEERIRFDLHGLLPPVIETLNSNVCEHMRRSEERMMIWNVTYFCEPYRTQTRPSFTLYSIVI